MRSLIFADLKNLPAKQTGRAVRKVVKLSKVVTSILAAVFVPAILDFPMSRFAIVPAAADHYRGAMINPEIKIGHVHLKVADLDRAIKFYCDVLGFTLKQRMGKSAAFLSSGTYHHHIGLNTWESKGGNPPAPGTTGLYHFAILYPTRRDLADALRRLTAANVKLSGAADHGVSEALYLQDPDGNGLELYWDKPEDKWPKDANGNIAMITEALDLEQLRAC